MADFSYILKYARTAEGSNDFFVEAEKYTGSTLVEKNDIICGIGNTDIYTELRCVISQTNFSIFSLVEGLIFNNTPVAKDSVVINQLVNDIPVMPTFNTITLLNSAQPGPAPTSEFDFYYRAKYGAEFPWPDEPGPGPTPGTPKIAGTYAHANFYPSGSHNIEASTDEPAKVFDVVTYNGLTPGDDYIIVGKVFDITDGKYISESATEKAFTAADVYGDEIVEFTIDATNLEGHTLVIFEELYTWDDHYLAEHSDRNDTDQHVYVLAPYDSDEGDDDEEAPYFCAVDENFNALGIVDAYESLIWTDRFDKAGDFEFYTLVDPNLFSLLKVDSYFYIPQSDRHMIVEKIEISSDPDDGDKLIVTGRSLESLLERRVIWKKTVINGNLQQSLKKIFEDNIINPPVGERRIANFVFKETSDPKITNLTLEAEYFGDNIYEVVCNVCQTNHIGFKIRLNSENQFVFELYSGEDRSYDNPNNNTNIIFGAEYDNVNNSNYIENKQNYKNVALVGTSSDDTTSSYGSKDYTGLSRRETYVSATDIDNEDMSKDEYKKALSDKGKEALKDYRNIKSFDGTMLNTDITYLRDYGLGDIIEYKDQYGHEDKARISELIINHDKNGFRIYPSFETLEDS